MEAIKAGLRDTVKYLPLLRELIKRDFTMKYKRTYLGILWTLLDPLLHMLVIIIIFSQLVGRDIQHYAAYIMTGRLTVQFFTQASGFCVNAFVGGGLYIKSVRMPLYMLPLSKTVSALINKLIALIILFFVILFTGVPFQPLMLFFPIPIMYTFLFSFGFGIALGTWMVFFRDVGHLHGVLATMLFFLTPIFWPIEIVPQNFMWIVKANPMYHFVTMMRNFVMYGNMPTTTDHMICAAFVIGALILGATAYNRGKNSFILHI
jgi:ABC-2 type transport system permease protein